MPGKVTLTIEPPCDEPIDPWEFADYDTVVFGRTAKGKLPDSDTQISRHHFFLEVQPPTAVVRDLGSLNKTYVNEVPYGGREKGETPEQGRQRTYPQVELQDGDIVRAGQTKLKIHIEAPAVCCQCETNIPESMRGQWKLGENNYLCARCRGKLLESEGSSANEPLSCKVCKRDVADEVGGQRPKHYVCQSCRAQPEACPDDELAEMVSEALERNDEQLHLLRPLAAGGQGAVYLARDMNGEQVAVKVLLADCAVHEAARRRFQLEIELLDKLEHAHMTRLISYGSYHTTFYFVMEFCEGGSLEDLLLRKRNRQPLQWEDVSTYFIQTLDGMAHAHQQGFVHRDIKPANILLSGTPGDYQAKVSDFGLAKNFQGAGFTGKSITGPNARAGTLYFMPREQFFDFRNVKPATDVWALGTTLYYLLTKQFPFDFDNHDPIDVIMNSSAISIRHRDPTIDPKLAEAIDRTLEDEPDHRYQNASEFRQAIRRVVEVNS